MSVLEGTCCLTGIKLYSVCNLTQITFTDSDSFINPTFRLEPKQSITSAILAASVAPLQLRGCSRVPRSPKCTMVSLSSAPQWLHFRPVPWRCSDVRSVTSNKRTYSLTGEQDVHTYRQKGNPAFQSSLNSLNKEFEASKKCIIMFINSCFTFNPAAHTSNVRASSTLSTFSVHSSMHALHC